jgi:hypothetical protein
MRCLAASLTRRFMRSFSDQKSILRLDTAPFPIRENPDSIYPEKPDLAAIEENAYVEYKKYPYMPHQDPRSRQYIASELDEYHERT